MPTRAERETVIVVNLADLDDGYFTVETTERPIFDRLRRLAGDRLQVEGERSSRTGRIQGWLCRVPAEFWRGSQLRVGAKRRRRVAASSLANLRPPTESILCSSASIDAGNLERNGSGASSGSDSERKPQKAR